MYLHLQARESSSRVSPPPEAAERSGHGVATRAENLSNMSPLDREATQRTSCYQCDLGGFSIIQIGASAFVFDLA